MTVRTITIKKIDEMTAAKFFTVLGMIWGIIMGILLALNIGAGASVMGPGSDMSAGAMIGGFFTMIILGAILFFVTSLVMAFVYNTVAEKTGEMKMTVEIPDE